MLIGVLGDSHGVLHDEVLKIFDGVDYILHCGGIGSPEVLERLSFVAPIAGVVGPQDTHEEYPFDKIFAVTWFETSVLVMHRIGDPTRVTKACREEIEKHDPQVVVFARSEGPFNQRSEGRLWFNPGPAGRKRSRFRLSVGLLEIEGRSIRGQVIPLDEA